MPANSQPSGLRASADSREGERLSGWSRQTDALIALAALAWALPCPLRCELLVDLDATALPTGSLVSWANNGSLGGNFVRQFDTPTVTTVSGVKAVYFDGSNDWFVGPTAPSSVTGNGSRTVIAWILNPSIGELETVIAWGRRGGPDRTLAGYGHGTHPTWGAAAQWGPVADVGWGGHQRANRWTCIAFTYDGDAITTSSYTDGLPSVAELNGPLDTFAVSTGGDPLPFVVGCQTHADGGRVNAAHPASMYMARVLVHDRALSAAEIAGAFNTDAASFGLPPVAVAPSIAWFRSSSEVIFEGDSATLSWDATGQTSLSLSPDTPLAPSQSSVVVSPVETTSYVLTAANSTGSASASLTVLVDPGRPVADGQSLDLDQGSNLAITLAGSDPNTAPGQLGFTVLGGPDHGALTGTAPDLVYTPAPGFAGSDAFTFAIDDGLNVSKAATVTLRVNPPPTPATAVSLDPADAPLLAAGSFVGSLQADDPNFGETHYFQLAAGPGSDDNARFTISGSQLLAIGDLSPFAGSTLSVRVRSTDSGGQASEQVILIPIPAPAAAVVINELFYDPPENQPTEFIELHNPTGAAVDLGNWAFTKGIDYSFPPGTSIGAGDYLVIARDPAAFLARFGAAALGPYLGSLASEGEKVELRDSGGLLVDVVDYRSEFPWPIGPGGNGPSMELIHPSLDNDLAGSWRSSTSLQNLPELTLVPARSGSWLYRKGTGEASSPVDAWRFTGFPTDGTWLPGQTPIGYGTVDNLPNNTTLGDMQGNYSSVFFRHDFSVATGELPTNLLLRYAQDDGIIIWINGVEVERRVMDDGDHPYNGTANTFQSPEGLWYEVNLTNGAALLTEGQNTIAAQVFNVSLGGSSDFGYDLELLRPASDPGLTAQPTPGAANSVHSPTAPPQIRQVDHSPKQASSGEDIVVTTKVTDPQGVAQVRLLYQVVAPGSFIPARLARTRDQILADPHGERPPNPAFENPASWITLPMIDDGSGDDETAGDSTFTATIPGQGHRTLVRYRIIAGDLGGASVRVPHADDPSLNFACFVYDGVPDYVASAASVSAAGPGKVWPKQLLDSIPVYHWLIRAEDMLTLQAYNWWEQFPNDETDNVLAARRVENWEGAFVYDGIVYDHVSTRLRGGNSRYVDAEGRYPNGKRHYKFRFNDGHHFQARDESGRAYPVKWKRLALSKMFGNKGGNAWGMENEIGSTLWSTFGVPGPLTDWIQFRVIDAAAEAPDQYHGDFWGLMQVVEEYDSSFLDARQMTKGNFYKMSDWIWDADRQRRYQSPDMVRDGSEFNNIRDRLHGGQSAAWLERYVDYDRWYRYSAVAEAIRHYDVFPYTEDYRHAMKNLAWYFEPVGPDPSRGVCTFIPYDWDASFGPNWNNGWEHANNALYGHDMSTSFGMPYVDKPAMKLEHRNVLREFRDLVWQPDQINGLIDDRARVIAELSKADQDRWRNAPLDAGTAIDDPLAAKVEDMKRFCFFGWSGATGPEVGGGGRAGYLDSIADNGDAGQLPATPVITYTGMPGHPLNGLSFRTTAFSDPQGAGNFAAMQWRIGQIEDPDAPAHDPDDDFVLEYTPVWESGTRSAYQSDITVPAGALRAGLSYRARVRMQDVTGRWSHWSAPLQFTTTTPDILAELAANLMITEIMYHPAPGEDHEFIELQNVSDTLTLDLSDVRFTKGVDFDFAGGAITSLAPGERVLVVKDIAAFESVHGSGLPVAGAWDPADNLANGGEQLKLSYGAGAAIHDFAYDDEAPWPEAADGDGPSLTLLDPASRPDHSLAASWTASAGPGGSPGATDSLFAAWLAARGASDPLADPDGDGMAHLLVYALGGDLLPRDLDALPGVGFTAGSGDDLHLTITFRKRDNDPALTHAVEVSHDLLSWLDGAGLTSQVGPAADNGDGTSTVTVRLDAPVAGLDAAFLRLRVGVEP